MKGCCAFLLLSAALAVAQAQAPACASDDTGCRLEAWAAANGGKVWESTWRALSPNGKLPKNIRATLLWFSDAADQEFLSRMGLTADELIKTRKELADLVQAYHLVPGVTITDSVIARFNDVPTWVPSGDINYVLQFTRDTKNGKVHVIDVQGNKVELRLPPVVINGLSIIRIDRVLMSGGYFVTNDALLAHYPQLRKAYQQAKATALPTLAKNDDKTVFVPTDSAFAAADLKGLSPADELKLVTYRQLPKALHIGTTLQSGTYDSSLQGHALRVEVTPGKDGVPQVQVFPESGPTAKVVLYNLYAGRSIFQGVNGVLRPELGSKRMAALKPAGGRKLLARHLAANGAGGGGGASFGRVQEMANTVAAQNTAAAIAAAANNKMPTAWAARYGTKQARAAAPQWLLRGDEWV